MVFDRYHSKKKRGSEEQQTIKFWHFSVKNKLLSLTHILMF
jgi:hypothetical protein